MSDRCEKTFQGARCCQEAHHDGWHTAKGGMSYDDDHWDLWCDTHPLAVMEDAMSASRQHPSDPAERVADALEFFRDVLVASGVFLLLVMVASLIWILLT